MAKDNDITHIHPDTPPTPLERQILRELYNPRFTRIIRRTLNPQIRNMSAHTPRHRYTRSLHPG